MKLNGNTFIITGGSSGLGAACTRRFAAAGAQILVADVKVEEGRSLEAELGGSARFVETDVTSEESVKALVEESGKLSGRLAGVINCAGIVHAATVLGKRGVHDLAAFSRVLAVNLTGTFNVIRLVAEAMSQVELTSSGERGVIINTASVAAFEGQIGQVAYSASKGGIVGMTLPLARELARYGIRVVTIAPGIFDTPMMASLPEPARQSLAQQVPFPPRLGKPEEFAALAQHVVENEMLNGEVIRLDGAIRMAPR